LKDRIAIVTGAARGLGEALALRFAEEGAPLALSDVDLENTQRTAQKVKELGRDALALKVDVSKYGEVQGLMEWGGEGKKWPQRSGFLCGLCVSKMQKKGGKHERDG
ncbi:MAG: SDR family NAD(P)-dependent oxidoreductase, partial [Deltaproteobacteria bacterium]|nr:SDR family NAD(P)-dependent oxidoreductase [Deltaproteobacteria bacterium]